MNRDFWKGKKVFLTGHTGFKGAWLSLWLQDCGAIIKGYSLEPNTKPNLFGVASVDEGLESIFADIRDLDSLRKSMSEFSPEIVFHMAAQPLVRFSYKNPVDTYGTNVMGTVNLLESVRSCQSIKVVVNITTDKCYENKEWNWGYRENESLGGHDPYSNSKACSELVTSAYRNSFFNYKDSAKVASVRAGNVIGGGDWAKDRLIPDILKSFANKRPVALRSPFAIRPWQHVIEPLSGYLRLAEKLYNYGNEYVGAWNFGPMEDGVKTVSEIVEYLVQKWGDEAKWFHEEIDKPHEAELLKLDIAKARSLLKWEPRWGIYTALDKIIEWEKAYNNGQSMKTFTLKQIKEYEENIIDG